MSYLLLESSAGVLVEVLAGIDLGIHVLYEGVGGADATGRVADGARRVLGVRTGAGHHDDSHQYDGKNTHHAEEKLLQVGAFFP